VVAAVVALVLVLEFLQIGSFSKGGAENVKGFGREEMVEGGGGEDAGNDDATCKENGIDSFFELLLAISLSLSGLRAFRERKPLASLLVTGNSHASTVTDDADLCSETFPFCSFVSFQPSSRAERAVENSQEDG